MVEMELAFLPSFLLTIWPDGSRCSIVSILGSNAPIYAVNVFLNAATVLRRCLLQSPIIVQGRLLFPALLAFPLFLSRFRHHLSLRRRGDSSNPIDFQTASSVSNAARRAAVTTHIVLSWKKVWRFAWRLRTAHGERSHMPLSFIASWLPSSLMPASTTSLPTESL
jgi:hypothetical protein